MKSMCPTFQALTVSVWREKIEGKYVVNTVSGCWYWMAGCDGDGYGAVSSKLGGRQRSTGAHRASWIAHRGPIPDGLTIDHLCWNRKCVNPDHLEPVTFEENNRRMIEIRKQVTWCRPGLSGSPKPLSERQGCGKHGKSDGKWTPRPGGKGTPFWRCGICSRESRRRYKARLKTLS